MLGQRPVAGEPVGGDIGRCGSRRLAQAIPVDDEVEERDGLQRRDVETGRRPSPSAAALDQAKASLDAADARVDAATRNLAVARLPARPDQIAAAEQTLAAREAAVTAATIRLARRTKAAPAAARVADTYFRVGEMVPAGSPVISLLPPENRKIIFFVPEPQRSAVRPGTRIALACDGCAAGLAATVTSIASAAEFAPPVIYSAESRAKLTYRVEARPDGAALALEPGQPLDVTLAGGTP